MLAESPAYEYIKRTGRCEEHELVQSEALATSFNDSGSCGLGESESGNGELGDLEESDVVSDGADDDGNAILLLTKVLNKAGE